MLAFKFIEIYQWPTSYFFFNFCSFYLLFRYGHEKKCCFHHVANEIKVCAYCDFFFVNDVDPKVYQRKTIRNHTFQNHGTQLQ